MNLMKPLLLSLLVSTSPLLPSAPLVATAAPSVAPAAAKPAKTASRELSPDTVQALDLARQLNHAFVAVADTVSPSVVVVEVTLKAGEEEEEENRYLEMLPPELRRYMEKYFKDEPGSRGPSKGRGSGFVITEDGYIVTNFHVVENAQKITVRFRDSKEFEAEVRGTDPRSDLAVLKIKGKGLLTARWGDSNDTRPGEFVLAIGAPFDLDYSVTVGHVSAKGRSFETMMGGDYVDQDFIQTDASINPGNSGGPLVNLYGEVIGINSMIRGMNTGIGFAIPSNLAKSVTDHLVKEGKFNRSWLGFIIVSLREDRKYRDFFPSLEEGVVISQIVPNSPAAKSDLQPGDVVLEADGKPVKTSRQLKELIASKPAGQTVALKVMRLGKENTPEPKLVQVNPEALPEDRAKGGKVKTRTTEAGAIGFGLTGRTLTAELAREFELEEPFPTGVIITDVDQNSPADQEDLQPGDVITEVNHKPVSSPKQFKEFTQNLPPKKGVILILQNKGSRRFVVLQNEE